MPGIGLESLDLHLLLCAKDQYSIALSHQSVCIWTLEQNF